MASTILIDASGFHVIFCSFQGQLGLFLVSDEP